MSHVRAKRLMSYGASFLGGQIGLHCISCIFYLSYPAVLGLGVLTAHLTFPPEFNK